MNRPVQRFVFIVLLGLGWIFLPGIHAHATNPEPLSIFREVERVELEFGEIYFSSISIVVPLPDGFMVLINQSPYTYKHTLLKFSKKGKITGKYDKRGNGPGEIRNVGNIVPLEKTVLISESSAPYVHEFSHDLEFIKDHRIKKGGKILLLGKYIGIWGLSYNKEENKDKAFILALYDRDTFEFRKYAFGIPEVPAYVYTWGGICRVDKNTFAGVYVTRYQIDMFDEEMNYRGSLLGKTPGYIKKYRPWKKDIHHADNTSLEWMRSWSKMNGLYYIDGKFIVPYMAEKERFLDIISREGKVLTGNYRESKNRAVLFTGGAHVWLWEWNDDKTKNYLVKTKLHLKP